MNNKMLIHNFNGKKFFNSKTVVCVILLITLMNMDLMAIGVSSTPTEAIEPAERIELIKSNFLGIRDLKVRDQPIRGVGINADGKACAPTKEPSCDMVLLHENLVAAASLSLDYQVNRNEESYNIVRNDIYYFISRDLKNTTEPTVGYKHSDEIDYQNPEIMFAIDQMMFMEFISEVYDNTKMGALPFNILEGFNASLRFIAEQNSSMSNKAPFGAYWTALRYNEKILNGELDLEDSVENPFPGEYNVPQTDVSMWAAAGYAHFASVLQDYYHNDPSFANWQEIDQNILDLKKSGMNSLEIYANLSASIINPYELTSIVTQMAREAFSYGDLYVFNKTLGLYGENQRADAEMYYVDTQVIALLAASRLYGATGEINYLYKADQIINSLVNKFWDAGRGGLFRTYNSSLQSQSERLRIKQGYDNALFAYALSQIAKYQGITEVKFNEFMEFSKPESEYMQLAEDVIAFMNRDLWYESATRDAVGYREWITSEGDYVGFGRDDATSRFVTTNMLNVYTLTMMIEYNIPFAEYYMNYILYLFMGVLAIAIIVYLIQLKTREGASTPDIVKSMMAGND